MRSRFGSEIFLVALVLVFLLVAMAVYWILPTHHGIERIVQPPVIEQVSP